MPDRRHLAAAVAAVLVLAACGEPEKDRRGVRVLTDMRWTPALQPQSAVVRRGPDGQPVSVPATLEPPPGTVPVGGVAEPPSEPAAWKALANPLVADARTLTRGRYHYDISCTPCHGRDGDAAHGLIAAYWSGIPSLNGASLNALSDGEVFGIISHGRNARMPSLAGQIMPADRWAVVLYLRALNRAAQDVEALTAALTAAEQAAAAKPEDAALVAEVAAVRARLDQARLDAARIGRIGTRAGAAFAPPPAPLPDWRPAEWKDGMPEDLRGHR
jgi:mono/diheme cytochrome c family protein